MNIPRFWARADAGAEAGAEAGTVACWRSSDSSLGDAEAKARKAAAALAERRRRGETIERRYCYADRPLREEILRRIPDHGGDLPGAAILTRNAYGSVVLNTADVMFIDVDFDEGDSKARSGILRRLFGGSQDSAREHRINELRDLVRSWASGAAAGSARLYETAAGARVMIVDGYYDPASEDTASIMDVFGADPKYRQLCRVQESFRARLTPKPWRCGVEPMPVRWPYRDAAESGAAERWQQRYDIEREAYAVCTLVESCGDAARAEPMARLVDLHDQWTGATTGLSLA